MRLALAASFCSRLLLLTPDAQAADAGGGQVPAEVIVTGTLRRQAADEVPGSTAVLDARTLRAGGQQQLQDVLGLIPNLNWAGDTARPRYFQIRGIGELEQYQGAPNPSVGFLIDDIDFSGLGTAATLYDVDQIEVLRGPQGTRYGANALAGLIYVKSREPTQDFEAGTDLSGGNYQTRSYGAFASGPLPGLDSSFRLAAQRYTSEGFYRNVWLGREDTNRRDELTLRARGRWQPAPGLRVDLTVLRVQIDNGYDAYAIDNSRVTRSDDPGVDAQHSSGLALKLVYGGSGAMSFTAVGTHARSIVHYAYDGDWGNPTLWAEPRFGAVLYRYTDVQSRDRRTSSLDLRLATSGDRRLDWLAGVYALELTEGFRDENRGLYQTVPSDPATLSRTDTAVTSHYRARNAALYGQLEGLLAPGLRASLGLRGEYRRADYHDLTTALGAPAAGNRFAPVDHLWGGDLSLAWRLASRQLWYATLQRGYKASGFNLSQGLPASQVLFRPESDVSLESGVKMHWAERVSLSADLYHTWRRALQLKTSEQLIADDPNSFVYYTQNVPRGHSYGLETALDWQATPTIAFGAALGLLQTRYAGLQQDGVTLPPRGLAHAPPWQAALHAEWRDPRGPFARLELTGMGSFWFDLPPNPTRSRPYGLVNLRAGWARPWGSVSLWARNLLDRNYAVRGFYFGDEPPDFPHKLYVQLGDPRVFGIDASLRLGSGH